ncbi:MULTISPECIES: ABC transporter ATP-binding protein [unclassified Bacillus (in: firmicutes)]|uniref:ABC transporter ATP-binding protein n=1 Tax=unclassified Bacillus (in: firmicutes) TaxID=185979 RepID=UPI0008E90389|nr:MULTISPECIES: ABC transporter ATP-binding protein [unclassified Bacillus (in: firmicutes)]SFA71730.1 ABC-2 type transport system ATP-binding protein [Bacillus sp. UNCCL13]SFQ61967.1 ABC-2 type transport system ATP-binding protein [Bacillus sp. cl95]
MSNVTLAVKDLRKTIGKKEIIKGLNFELREGEVFGFLGPNGAGKTTTIRMIVGLIKPTSGSIEICGQDLREHFSEAMQHLGCIVENPELYPYLSGWDNLLHFARMLEGIDERRMNEVIELVGLQERIHDKVKTYSLGMRQRIGIAQALLGRPKVLILDEPTNGLDPAGIREMRQFIRFLAEEEGLSVLVSSHLLSEIQLMCDRVAIVSKGKIVTTDTVQTLLSNRERIVWKVEPLDKALEVLRGEANVEDREDGMISTEYDAVKASEWNHRLVEAGVRVSEMNRKLPVLEELFLELTGGDKID